MTILARGNTSHEPDPATPLTLHLTYAELLEIYGLLGECPWRRVAPIINALAKQVEAQLQSASHLQAPVEHRVTQ